MREESLGVDGLKSQGSKSLTEEYSPFFRRKQKKTGYQKQLPNGQDVDVEEIRKGVEKDFSRMNKIIQSLTEIFNARMQVHENELMKIMREEILAMKADIAHIVDKYTQMEAGKNTHVELTKAKSELDYFRQISLQLFQDNQRLKLQIKALKTQSTDVLHQNQSLKSALFHLTQKSIRSKSTPKISDQKRNLHPPSNLPDQIPSKILPTFSTQIALSPSQQSPQHSKRYKSNQQSIKPNFFHPLSIPNP